MCIFWKKFVVKNGFRVLQLNHYVTPTLEEYGYDAAIINVGINDILRSKHYEELGKSGNLETCQKYNIGKIFISAVLPLTKTNHEFIDHQFLWNDGIHLLDTHRSILGQNFVNRVSNFFAKMILF